LQQNVLYSGVLARNLSIGDDLDMSLMVAVRRLCNLAVPRLLVVVVHGRDRLGKLALVLQVLPPVLGEVHKCHKTELNGKQNVECPQALPVHELVCVQAGVDVVESEQHSARSGQPVCSKPHWPGSHSTAQSAKHTSQKVTQNL